MRGRTLCDHLTNHPTFYPQPGSPLEGQLSGPPSHLFDSPPQQHWARGMGAAPGPDLNGLYDPRYESVVPQPALDQYGYKGRATYTP